MEGMARPRLVLFMNGPIYYNDFEDFDTSNNGDKNEEEEEEDAEDLLEMIDVDALGDWRTFRRNLMTSDAAGEEETTTTASSTTTSNNKTSKARIVINSSKNEQLLKSQNEKLAAEYKRDVWAHPTSTVRAGKQMYRQLATTYTARHHKGETPIDDCTSQIPFFLFLLSLPALSHTNLPMIFDFGAARSRWIGRADATGIRIASQLQAFRDGTQTAGQTASTVAQGSASKTAAAAAAKTNGQGRRSEQANQQRDGVDPK